MGVPVYVTRRPLPGAAVTQKCALRYAEQPSREGEGLSINSSQSASIPPAAPSPLQKNASPAAAQALRESLRKDAPQPRGSQQPSAVESAAANTAKNEAVRSPAVTRFRLAAVICAGRLWVEELGDEALAQDQVQLVSAMGRALMHPEGGSEAIAVTEFQWPLHDNAQLGLGAEEATATLQGFLHRQLDENACVELICLGDESKALLANLPVSCARRFAPSTRDMLASPILKRDVWAALQA